MTKGKDISFHYTIVQKNFGSDEGLVLCCMIFDGGGNNLERTHLDTGRAF